LSNEGERSKKIILISYRKLFEEKIYGLFEENISFIHCVAISC